MQTVQLVDFAAIIVTVFFFGLGSYFDLKTREVDDWVWLAYGPIGLALTVVRLLVDPSTLFLTLVSIAITTVVSFGLFYFGLFGGADCKAIICLGLTMPLPPSSFQPVLGYLHPVFPVVVVVTGFLCSVAIAVWYGLRNLATYLARRERMFEGLQEEGWWRKVMACILGYRTELLKLRSTFYLYPMEEVVQGAEGTHRALKLYMNAETDREPLASELSDSLAKLGYEGKVWVTPGIPMLLFILIGLILTLILGDIVFSTVFILARAG